MTEVEGPYEVSFPFFIIHLIMCPEAFKSHVRCVKTCRPQLAYRSREALVESREIVNKWRFGESRFAELS